MSDLERLRGASVLIVGDVMLDEYVWGQVARISPEAPVPVVEVTHRTHVPGGAANVAAGVMALGGSASLCGVIGDDVAGEALRGELLAVGVGVDGLAVDPSRPTTAKTRVVAHAQQVVRIDSERCGPLAEEPAAAMLEDVRRRVGEADSVVISDYGKGVVTEALVQSVIRAAHAAGRPVIVDPKGLDFSKYRGATLITPNELEFIRAAHVQVDDEADLLEAARSMAQTVGVGLLVTRGAHGMCLVADDTVFTVAARARDVYDVTGAGDTVVATLSVASGRGFSLRRSVELANEAAGISVGKIGTSTVTLSEIAERLGN